MIRKKEIISYGFNWTIQKADQENEDKKQLHDL